MNDDLVILNRHSEDYVTCILNRPEKRNALSIELMQQLCAQMEAIAADPKVRVLALRGNGPVFSAGLDLSEVMNREYWEESAGMVKKTLSTLYMLPVATVAMVHGLAMGGGAGLVAACDFAVADNKATIGFPELRRGLVAAQVMSILVRKLALTNVRYLLLTGETVSASHALRMGLFHHVGDLEIETRKIVAQVLRGAPRALATTKRLLDQLYAHSLKEDIDLCMERHLQARGGEEAQEGICAFLEKRAPAWDKGEKISG
jgi:enoyl-CoA hydratase/carnithine racemase